MIRFALMIYPPWLTVLNQSMSCTVTDSDRPDITAMADWALGGCLISPSALISPLQRETIRLRGGGGRHWIVSAHSLIARKNYEFWKRMSSQRENFFFSLFFFLLRNIILSCRCVVVIVVDIVVDVTVFAAGFVVAAAAVVAVVVDDDVVVVAVAVAVLCGLCFCGSSGGGGSGESGPP